MTNSTPMPRPTSTHVVSGEAGRALDELVRGARAGRAIASNPVGDAIVLDDLAKTYPDGNQAVKGISLRVSSGEAYGILGPNGAGKSTTMGMLGTLVRPSGGRALVAGYDVAAEPMEVRRRIGFAMQQTGVDEFATASELVVLQGRLQGLTRQAATTRARLLLGVMELEHVGHRRLATLSAGTRRRVDLAASLVHLPPILFLDEPSEGMDPRSRAAFWDTLEQPRRRLGTTVVLTTHDMEEGDLLCDRIGIVDGGRLVAQGTPKMLKATVASLGSPGVATAPPTLGDVYLHYTGRAFAATTSADDVDDRRAA
jgi:ABC-2 type transport system ATP-binding protein